MPVNPDDAPHSDKVRATYDEMVREHREIDREAFVQYFLNLRIQLAPDVVSNIFNKTAVSNGRVMSFAEYQRFGQIYPTILDCLYYRSRDVQQDRQEREKIKDMQDRLTTAQRAESEAANAHLQQQANTDSVGHKLTDSTANLSQAQEAEKDAKAMLDRAHELIDSQRMAVKERQAELKRRRDVERGQQAKAADTQKDIQAAANGVRNAEMELRKAEDRLRDLERMVQEQKMEVEKKLQFLDQAREREDRMRDHEYAVRAETERFSADAAIAAERLSEAEAELAALADKEKEAAAALRNANANTARAQAARDQAERELGMAQEKEMAARAAEENAARNTREIARQLEGLERQNADFNNQRLSIEAEEKALLEEEVALREQRESLEGREAMLRANHHNFHSKRSSSPDPQMRDHRREPSEGYQSHGGSLPATNNFSPPRGSSSPRFESHQQQPRDGGVYGTANGGGYSPYNTSGQPQRDAGYASPQHSTRDGYPTSSPSPYSGGRDYPQYSPVKQERGRSMPMKDHMTPDRDGSQGRQQFSPPRNASHHDSFGSPAQEAGGFASSPSNFQRKSPPRSGLRSPHASEANLSTASPGCFESPFDSGKYRKEHGSSSPYHGGYSQSPAKTGNKLDTTTSSMTSSSSSSSSSSAAPTKQSYSSKPQPYTSKPHSHSSQPPKTGKESSSYSHHSSPSGQERPLSGAGGGGQGEVKPDTSVSSMSSSSSSSKHGSAGQTHSSQPSGGMQSAGESAEVLYKAMKGLGTDEDAIFKTLSNVRTRWEWTEIKKAFAEKYPKMANGDLVRAMKDDLTSKEFDKCKGILADKGINLA